MACLHSFAILCFFILAHHVGRKLNVIMGNVAVAYLPTFYKTRSILSENFGNFVVKKRLAYLYLVAIIVCDDE